MANDFPIEPGIPIPEPHRNHSPYPLAALGVWDSFLVPAPTPVGLRPNLYAAAKKLRIKIALRVVEGGVRVWRIPDNTTAPIASDAPPTEETP